MGLFSQHKFRRIMLFCLELILFIGILISIGFYGGDNHSHDDGLLDDHQELAVHNHINLEITVLGKEQIIPGNIGVYENGMAPIHTHESGGRFHIESVEYREFYLGDLFKVWGETLTNECIFDNCVDAGHVLKMYVNGVESDLYENLELNDQDVISINYSKI